MKQALARLIEHAHPEHRADLAREYLQARMLQFLSLNGQMNMIAFMGGTALRFVYGVPRYSEDLDFALELRPDDYSFDALIDGVTRGFEREAYQVEVPKRAQRTNVHKAFVKFPGLLYELGLSPHEHQVLSVKLEVDTNPPAGAGLEVTQVTRFVPVRVLHHDRATLFAGKIAAVLARKYTKGRDLYDLMWYLGDRTWPDPNIVLLRNALAQGEWQGALPTDDTWRDLILSHLQTVDWAEARRELQQFLEVPEEVSLIELDTYEVLLRDRSRPKD